MKYVNKDCEVLNCPQLALMVYIEGCDHDEVTDFMVCVEHAYEFCLTGESCEHGHMILEKLVKMIDGTDPLDARFYQGEWVAIHHEKVVYHGNNPQAMIDHTISQKMAGANIFYVRESGESSWIG